MHATELIEWLRASAPVTASAVRAIGHHVSRGLLLVEICAATSVVLESGWLYCTFSSCLPAAPYCLQSPLTLRGTGFAVGTGAPRGRAPGPMQSAVV